MERNATFVVIQACVLRKHYEFKIYFSGLIIFFPFLGLSKENYEISIFVLKKN